jgi:hypothetical protein
MRLPIIELYNRCSCMPAMLGPSTGLQPGEMGRSDRPRSASYIRNTLSAADLCHFPEYQLPGVPPLLSAWRRRSPALAFHRLRRLLRGAPFRQEVRRDDPLCRLDVPGAHRLRLVLGRHTAGGELSVDFVDILQAPPVHLPEMRSQRTKRVRDALLVVTGELSAARRALISRTAILEPPSRSRTAARSGRGAA